MGPSTLAVAVAPEPADGCGPGTRVADQPASAAEPRGARPGAQAVRPPPENCRLAKSVAPTVTARRRG